MYHYHQNPHQFSFSHPTKPAPRKNPKTPQTIAPIRIVSPLKNCGASKRNMQAPSPRPPPARAPKNVPAITFSMLVSSFDIVLFSSPFVGSIARADEQSKEIADELAEICGEQNVPWMIRQPIDRLVKQFSTAHLARCRPSLLVSSNVRGIHTNR